MIKKIGQKLKTLRLKHCISQKVIANELGISIALYSKIETGLSDISFNKTQQIADFYGIYLIDVLRIGENEIQYPDYKQLLEDMSVKFGEQQKKMILLHEIIRGIQKNIA